MTLVTARDYAWIRSSRMLGDALRGGYGLALVRGTTPTDVLRLMETEPKGTGEGLDALVEEHPEHRDATDYRDDSFIAGTFTVPGTDGEWTLVFDFNGGRGDVTVHAVPVAGRASRVAFHQRGRADRPLRLV
ncbi:DUF6461 domain-containing protein [Streptomyces sp. MRC013]|uniref:DUF6461 domain-containing protein n=1 Tax=Streptomyces sp. MRC013 TaxID=2898276 RepID=UPI0024E2242E|nr:DUF6461 domain-containing protein [Streptomyces sp. MRC013]